MNRAALCISVCIGGWLPSSASASERNWPQWRGPTATGVLEGAQPPLKWSDHENVRWKVEIPGEGLGTPVIWGDRVFIMTAIPEDDPAAAEGQAEEEESVRGGRGSRRGAPDREFRFTVLALDRATGKTVWERVVTREQPHDGAHQDGSQASSSALTDGEHVFAYFGSRGLYCLTMDGELVWSKRFGEMQTRNGFGEGSSPALDGDTLVINWDHEGDDFIVALNKRTGEEKWRRERDEPTSWATPVIVESGGRKQVIVSASNFIMGYDLESGDEVWRCAGMTLNVVPTPVVRGDRLFAMSGFRGNALLAIRYEGAKGDISDTPYVVWRYEERNTPYVPSPLLVDDLLYFLDNNRAILTCLDTSDGEVVYERQRLEDMQGVYASPVAAAGRIYIAGRDGKTAVLAHGREYKLLAMNELDDSFTASPALAGNELFLRGLKHLYCIAEK